MNIVWGVLLKFLQHVVVPMAKKLFGFIYKKLRQRYESDEKFRRQVDETAKQLLIKHGPKVVQLYYELVLGQKTPPTCDPSPEEELIRTVSKTAKAGYKVAKQAGHAAGKKAGGAINRAGQWLLEDVPPNDQPPQETNTDEGAPTGESPLSEEDEELERLKQKLAREQAEAEAKKKPSEPFDIERPTSDDLDRIVNEKDPKDN